MIQDFDVKNLALYAPRVAYAMIAGIPRVPFVNDVPIQFSSATVNAPPVVGAFQNMLAQDTIIERVSFSLFQQNTFSGSPFQSLYFAMLKAISGVGVQMSVFGGPKYNVNDTFTALENLADVLAITWPQGWPLYKGSNVKVEAVLLQTPFSTPYDVNLSFLGWQWLDAELDAMSDDEARRRLRRLGIETPDLAQLLVAGSATAPHKPGNAPGGG
jgi:hypothetical protein